MLTRVSARASGAPGQLCTPRPNAMWRRAFVRFEVEGVGILELARIAVGRPVHHHHRGAGGNVDAADGHVAPRQPEVTLHRALDSAGTPR